MINQKIEMFTTTESTIQKINEFQRAERSKETVSCIPINQELKQVVDTIKVYKRLSTGFTATNKLMFIDSDSKFVLLTETKFLTIWDNTKSKPLRRLQTNQQSCLNFSELSNGKLAVASRDNTLKIYNIHNGSMERSLSAETMYIQFIVEVPKSILFTCALNGKKKVYDLKKPDHSAVTQTTLGSGDLYDCAILLKDDLIALGINNFIRIYSIKDLVNVIKSLRGHTRPVLDLLLLEDGKTLVSAGQDKTIRVWDWESETLLRTFIGHKASVRRVIMVDEAIMASLSIDRFIKIWDFKSGECLKTIDEMKSSTDDVLKRSDRVIVAFGASGYIRFWSGKENVSSDCAEIE